MPDPSQVYGNARSLTHWARPGIKPASLWLPVRFVSTESWRELPVGFLFFVFCFFLKVSFSIPYLFPRDCAKCFTDISFILKLSRGWAFQKLDFEGNHLRRGTRLETDLCSYLRMSLSTSVIIHYSQTPSSSSTQCCLALLLGNSEISGKYGWCVPFINIYWMPAGTMHWGGVRDIVVNKTILLFSGSLHSVRKDRHWNIPINIKYIQCK